MELITQISQERGNLEWAATSSIPYIERMTPEYGATSNTTLCHQSGTRVYGPKLFGPVITGMWTTTDFLN